MKNNYFRWLNGNSYQYASSIAATWIWAPSLMVSSMQAYNNGLPGFLMFVIPNFLTLIIFGFVVDYVRRRINNEGYTMADALEGADDRQKKLNVIMSCVLLILSTCCQIVGIHTAISFLIGNKLINSLIVSLLSLTLVWRSGIKGSIITDSVKYIILFVCAAYMVINADHNAFMLVGASGLTVSEVWSTFGLTTCIGLLSAPYIDNTFWQRGFSMPREKIIFNFISAAGLFVLIPLSFGYIGFCGSVSLSVTLRWVMLIAVVCALVSTLDSNLIAIAGYSNKFFGLNEKNSKLSMVIILLAACLIFSLDIFELTKLFLCYNTVRACMVLATLFIIFDCYNKKVLYYSTLLVSLICPISYMLTNNALFTVIALIVPALSYRKHKKERTGIYR